MTRLTHSIIIYLIVVSTAMAQSNREIMKRVHSNIQGFELNNFLEESESLNTEIIVDKIEELDLQCRLSYKKLPVDISYPKSGIQLLAIEKKGVICGEILKTQTIYDGYEYNIFLVGIDTASSERVKPIKYISGQMFLDNISQDFELDINKPETYMDYIKLKMFDLQVDRLKFIKRKQGILYYQGYSNLKNKKLNLSIDTHSWSNEIKIETWL